MLLASDTSEDSETDSALMSLPYITSYHPQKEAPAQAENQLHLYRCHKPITTRDPFEHTGDRNTAQSLDPSPLPPPYSTRRQNLASSYSYA